MCHVDALSRMPIVSAEEVFDEQLNICVVLTQEERVPNF